MSASPVRDNADLLGRMRQVAARGGERTPGAPAVAGEKTKRLTLDLVPLQHRFLRQFALDAGSDASAVLRCLIGMIEQDPVLAARVIAQVGDAS